MIGLGMTLDLRGKYDEAVKALLAAADLDPPTRAVTSFSPRPMTVLQVRLER